MSKPTNIITEICAVKIGSETQVQAWQYKDGKFVDGILASAAQGKPRKKVFETVRDDLSKRGFILSDGAAAVLTRECGKP